LQARRRRGIDQGGGAILLIEQLQEPGIKDPVPCDNQNPTGIVRPVFRRARADIERNFSAIRRGPGEVLRDQHRRAGEDNCFR
jgi:hypothetical protein